MSNDTGQVIDHGEGIYELPGKIECPNPRCKVDISGAGVTDEGKVQAPSHGDLTMCAYCETICRYHKRGKRFSLIKLTEAELDKLDPETRATFVTLSRRLYMVYGPVSNRVAVLSSKRKH